MSKKRRVLPEEEYEQTLEEIISRDFFPDVKRIRQVLDNEADTHLLGEEATDADPPGPPMSLDQFQATHITEDDLDFEKILRTEKQERQLRLAWMQEESRRHNLALEAAEQALQTHTPESVEGLLVGGTKIKEIQDKLKQTGMLTNRHVPESVLMFPPSQPVDNFGRPILAAAAAAVTDGTTAAGSVGAAGAAGTTTTAAVTDSEVNGTRQGPTGVVSGPTGVVSGPTGVVSGPTGVVSGPTESSIVPISWAVELKPEVVHPNTRFSLAEQSGLDTMRLAPLDELETERDRQIQLRQRRAAASDLAMQTGRFDHSGLGGLRIERTPIVTPEEVPMMTWGEVTATPLVLPPEEEEKFTMQVQSEREALADSLRARVTGKAREKRRNTVAIKDMAASLTKTPLRTPLTAGSIFGGVSAVRSRDTAASAVLMTPLGQSLAKNITNKKKS